MQKNEGSASAPSLISRTSQGFLADIRASFLRPPKYNYPNARPSPARQDVTDLRPGPPFRPGTPSFPSDLTLLSTPSIPSGRGLYPARKTVRQALSEDRIGEKRKARSTSKKEALRACLCSYTFVCRNYPKLSNIRFFIGTPRLSSMPSTALLIGPGPHM